MNVFPVDVSLSLKKANVAPTTKAAATAIDARDKRIFVLIFIPIYLSPPFIVKL